MILTWTGSAGLHIAAEGGALLINPFVTLQGGETIITLEDIYSIMNGGGTFERPGSGQTEDAGAGYPDAGDDGAAPCPIFATDASFMHLFFAQQLLNDVHSTLFCSREAAALLGDFLEEEDLVVSVRPGQALSLPGMKVRVLQGGSADEKSAYSRKGGRAGRAAGNGSKDGEGRPGREEGKSAAGSDRRSSVLKNAKNLPFLHWAKRTFPESSDPLALCIEAEDRQILVLNDLRLPASFAQWPAEPDLLVMPCQVQGDLAGMAREILEHTEPEHILLTHFDDTCPPVSKHMDLSPLAKMLREEHPDIHVVKPKAGKALKF